MRIATSLKKDKLAVNRSQTFRLETCPTSLRTRSNEEKEEKCVCVCVLVCLCLCVPVCLCVRLKMCHDMLIHPMV